MLITILFFQLFSTYHQNPGKCTWISLGGSVSNTSISGNQILIMGKKGVLRKIPGYKYRYLPPSPNIKAYQNDVINNLWEKIPFVTKLFSTTSGDVYLFSKDRLAFLEKNSWNILPFKNLNNLAAGANQLFFISKNRLVSLKSGKVTDKKVLPTLSKIIDISAFKNKVILLSKNGIYASKDLGKTYLFIPLLYPRFVIANRSGCTVFSKTGVYTCRGKLIQNKYFSKVWKTNDTIWGISGQRLGYLDGKLFKECDNGLVPNEVNKVLPGPVVISQDSMYISLNNYANTQSNSLFKKSYDTGNSLSFNCKSPLVIYHKIPTTSYYKYLPVFEITGYMNRLKTIISSDIFSKTDFSLFFNLKWRSSNEYHEKKVSEMRKIIYEKEKFLKVKFERCVAGFRLGLILQKMKKSIYKIILMNRYEELAGEGNKNAII